MNDQLLGGSVPRPRLGHRERPQAQVERAHARPHEPHLLPTRADDLFHVPERCLQAEPIRHQSQDVRH
ncbi:hypothetical protein NL533_34330, partial [Klebsiella pneumoniae]|nr:hypothetical protein [Klebsiella pneumoniae]